MDKKKMKNVEVSIWTPGLNMANITPVTREYAEQHIEDGEVPEDVNEDFDFSIPVYFCDDQKVNITVNDGENEKKYTGVYLNSVDFGYINETKDSDLSGWCNRDYYDSDEEYAEDFDKMLCDDDEFHCAWLTKNIDLDEASKVFHEFWEANLEEWFALLNNYLKLVAKEAIDNAPGDDMVNFVELGEIGKGMVSFRIEIPEDEEFELKKLHFIFAGDIEDFPAGFDVYLSSSFRLLEDVEYDGRIYNEKDVDFIPGWRDYYGGHFYEADLSPMEDIEEDD